MYCNNEQVQCELNGCHLKKETFSVTKIPYKFLLFKIKITLKFYFKVKTLTVS